MNKSRLSIVCCLIAMMMLLGCSADGLINVKTTSAEQLRALLAQKTEYATQPSTKPPEPAREPATHSPESATEPSTQPPDYEPPTKPSESYEYELGYLPPEAYENLTEAEKRGQQTWYFWTGGNETLYRTLAKKTHGEVDFLSLVDARPKDDPSPGDKHFQRKERFKLIGALNDPGCKAASEPDEYGLWLDECQDPHSAGIVGTRKFPNPNFDPNKWDIAQYYQQGAQIEPPYRIGISCGVCHIAFDPLNPPDDLENPKWENLVAALGNQYLREGILFGSNLPEDSFRRQVLVTQPPGTSDTSRIATDHINNPNAINPIFNLADRPKHEEVMNDGTVQAVNHILKDGADSVGIALASLRVYTNIGMCSDYWLSLHDPLLGRKDQKPFDIETARKECEGWRQTEVRMDDAEAFLKTLKPMYLKDAPDGEDYLTEDESVLERGKIAFADTCASCHSSKQPPAEIAADPEQAKQWYRESVLSSDFLDRNFLSDDKRYPVTLIGTNADRALATNAKEDHIWEQFSSKTYKELPSPGTLTLENPFEDKPLKLKVPAGGTGYYRTPSLISMWATAPYFHNNMLGDYISDPSVKGRMKAFEDATEKLLWPEKRDEIIKRTTRETMLELGELETLVPKGTPIDLLANLDPRTLPDIVQAKLNSPIGSEILEAAAKFIPDDVVVPVLLKKNQTRDFVEDHGHYFGTDLPDEDKRSLIEFLKTL